MAKRPQRRHRLLPRPGLCRSEQPQPAQTQTVRRASGARRRVHVTSTRAQITCNPVPPGRGVLEYRGTTALRWNRCSRTHCPSGAHQRCSGIGTGFSTCVPSFDPLRSSPTRLPRQAGADAHGCASRAASALRTRRGGAETIASGRTARLRVSLVIEITELPVGTWTSDYKGGLRNRSAKDGWPRDIKSYCTDTDVRFTLKYASSPTPTPRCMDKGTSWRRPLEHASRNMRLFGADASVKRYAGVDLHRPRHRAQYGRTWLIGAPVDRNWS
jgi:hypothetical protein